MHILFSSYPNLKSKSGRVELRRPSTEDLPVFLYDHKYDTAGEMLQHLDAECFDTKESVFLGIYAGSFCGFKLRKGKASDDWGFSENVIVDKYILEKNDGDAAKFYR